MMSSHEEYQELLTSALGRFQSITNQAFVDTCKISSVEVETEAAARRYLDALLTKMHHLAGTTSIPTAWQGEITASWKVWVVGGQFYEFIQSNGERTAADYDRVKLELLNKEALIAMIAEGSIRQWKWREAEADFPPEMTSVAVRDIRKVVDSMMELCKERYPEQFQGS